MYVSVFLNKSKTANPIKQIFLEVFPCSRTGFSKKKRICIQNMFLFRKPVFPKMMRELNSLYTNIEIPYL